MRTAVEREVGMRPKDISAACEGAEVGDEKRRGEIGGVGVGL